MNSTCYMLSLPLITFLFAALQVVVLKEARVTVNPESIIWWRSVTGLSLLWLYKRITQLDVPLFSAEKFPRHFLRTTFGGLALFCMAYTAKFLTTAEFTAIHFSGAIMTAVLGRIVLKEALPQLRILAIFFGFIGVLLVVQPGYEGFSFAKGILLLGCLFISAHDITLKGLTEGTHPITLTAMYLLILGVALSPIVIGDLSEYSVRSVWWLLLYGFVGTTFQILLSESYRLYKASALAPFVYTSFLWSIAFDAILWGDYLDLGGLLGAFFIMADGFLAAAIVWLEAREKKPKAEEHGLEQLPAPSSLPLPS